MKGLVKIFDNETCFYNLEHWCRRIERTHELAKNLASVGPIRNQRSIGHDRQKYTEFVRAGEGRYASSSFVWMTASIRMCPTSRTLDAAIAKWLIEFSRQ